MSLSAWPTLNPFPKKSIMTPIGALALGIFATSVAGSVAVWPSPLSWALLAIATVTLGVALWAYIYFALRDPDRLQTEDYRIQKEVIARLPNTLDLSPMKLPPPDAKLITHIRSEDDE